VELSIPSQKFNIRTELIDHLAAGRRIGNDSHIFNNLA